MKGKKNFDLQKTFSNAADKPSNPQEDTVPNEEAPTTGTGYDVREGLNKLPKNIPIPYTTMKVKKEQHRQLKSVAKRENVNAVDLLDHIISDWLRLYENTK